MYALYMHVYIYIHIYALDRLYRLLFQRTYFHHFHWVGLEKKHAKTSENPAVFFPCQYGAFLQFVASMLGCLGTSLHWWCHYAIVRILGFAHLYPI